MVLKALSSTTYATDKLCVCIFPSLKQVCQLNASSTVLHLEGKNHTAALQFLPASPTQAPKYETGLVEEKLPEMFNLYSISDQFVYLKLSADPNLDRFKEKI